MSWKPLENPGKHRWGSGYGEGPDTALARRYYGWNGKTWPRLILAVYASHESLARYTLGVEGLYIETCWKEKRGQEWITSGPARMPVPLNLYGDLLEMLHEAKTRTETT